MNLLKQYIDDYIWWYKKQAPKYGYFVVYLIVGLMREYLIETALIERHKNDYRDYR